MSKKKPEERSEERSPPQGNAPESRFRVEKYKKSRHFALYDGEELLAVMALTVFSSQKKSR